MFAPLCYGSSRPSKKGQKAPNFQLFLFTILQILYPATTAVCQLHACQIKFKPNFNIIINWQFWLSQGVYSRYTFGYPPKSGGNGWNNIFTGSSRSCYNVKIWVLKKGQKFIFFNLPPIQSVHSKIKKLDNKGFY